MDGQQDYDEDTSSEDALPVIWVKSSYEVSIQRGRQNEQTPEQHVGEEPDTQDDSSHDEEDLDSEMDVDDEGIEYTSDMSEDLSDGKLGFQSGEDSEDSEDHGVEMEPDSAGDVDLENMFDGLSDEFSDFEAGEDTEEHQPNRVSDSQDETSNDEMSVDDEDGEASGDMSKTLSDGASDDEQGGETGQQSHQLVAPEDSETEEPTQIETEDCTACYTEDIPVTLLQELICGHVYCRPCLIHIFKTSLLFASHFPARCCYEEIPLEAIEAHMHQSDVQRYREKLLEHRTINRTYCSNRQCLEFIPPNNISDGGEPCYGHEAECPACKEVTCTKCKDKRHTGACEKKADMDQTLDLAQSEGWKRCSRCGHLIEKIDGCYHIICHCGYEFCYKMPIQPLNNTTPCPIGTQCEPSSAPTDALAPCVSAMAAETLSRISTAGLRMIISNRGEVCEAADHRRISGDRLNTPPATRMKPSLFVLTTRSDDRIYMIDVKSVFDPDCAIYSRRVLLNKIPQGTTLTQIANAVYGVYTTHVVNGCCWQLSMLTAKASEASDYLRNDTRIDSEETCALEYIGLQIGDGLG
ncbi:e3 ubiquitin ligase ARI10 [Fusarium tjaetaba]|uniref:RBR-type E3 ubiquitin transferase n=1 Tax=Fusarium tjaetaba TaxID=1567544 RepID=A0A8H5SEI4_9HYPO|nr:e3 ubiquitin ligase ARI10 [Fusarium tjaetaba]KAF5649514.1 e3 ubiquitin ligase ARI10 [Fusarium tjaetaba]